jgi:hypothetical protein
LYNAKGALKDSFVTKQLFEGHVKPEDIKTSGSLDPWINSRLAPMSKLSTLNLDNLTAVALEDLTTKATVLIEGPPGT